MTLIMKATEFEDQSAAFKKSFPNGVQELADRGWLLQPKYDGCFGMAVIRRDGDSRMLSRTGEDYSASCGHILEDLETLATQRHQDNWTEFVVLGEVWHPVWAFPQISGSFRRRRPCDDLWFMAHDLLPITLATSTAYVARHQTLLFLMNGGRNRVRPVLNHVDTADVAAYAVNLKLSGHYDGAVLKDPNAGYNIGNVRLGQIVKVKPTQSLDLRVDAWAGEPGEKTGRYVYTVRVTYRGVSTWAGSGIPHDYVPENGHMIEVEFMGFTADGALREPRFKGQRHDKPTPDA